VNWSEFILRDEAFQVGESLHERKILCSAGSHMYSVQVHHWHVTSTLSSRQHRAAFMEKRLETVRDLQTKIPLSLESTFH